MNSNEIVPVVIVNYKTSDLIKKLVSEIKEESIEVRIIILDNGSTEESLLQLKEIKDNRTQILCSPENLGFTGGMNFALRYIEKHLPQAKYAFLLNPDASVSPNLVGGLVSEIKKEVNAACISPQIFHSNGNSAYSGSRIDFRKGVVSTSLQQKTNEHERLYEVDAFTGCAVLIDLKKFIAAGMFNEQLFMYFDEADISIRLRKAGYNIFYTPAYKVIHDTSYTTRDISFVKTYFMTRNKFIVFGSTMTLYNKIYYLLYELAYHLKNRRLKNSYYHVKGFLDFRSGKTGNRFSKI